MRFTGGGSGREDVMEVLNFPILDLQFVGSGRHGFADHAASIMCAFSHVIDEYSPRAVLAMGSSDALLACSLVTRKRGLPLARSLREQIDWARVRRDTAHSPYAETFLILLDRLDVVPLDQQGAGADDGRPPKTHEVAA